MIFLLSPGGPSDSVDHSVQENRVGKRFAGVAVRRSENPSLAVLIGPVDGVIVSTFLAF